MQIFISGQHFQVTDNLKNYIDDKMHKIIEKYFEHATSVNVHLVKEQHRNLIEFCCDIVVHDGSGRHMLIKSSARCDEPYSSFDLAAVRVEKQLRKYKSKLKDHSKDIKLSELNSDAVKYILKVSNTESDLNTKDDNPLIIAEKPTHVMSLSVSEAVMKMDLEELEALMFKNSKTSRVNVVYHRKDGNIAWIDSK